MRSYIPTTLVAAALWAVAATFVGCSDDEVVTTGAAPAAINFTPVLNKANSVTRSVTPLLNGDFKNFGVWAFKADEGSDAAFVMGKSATVPTIMRKGSSIGNYIDNPSSKIWGYANAREVAFWPSGTQKLQFYALWPVEADGLRLSMNKANHAFTYVPSDEDHSLQRDLIAAATSVKLTDVTKPTKTEKEQLLVGLTFQHLLSQVVFEAKLEENVPKFEVNIQSIELCNIYTEAKCVLQNPTEENNNQVATWVGTTKGSYKLDFGEDKKLSTTDGTDGNVTEVMKLTNGDDADNSDNLMMIPQEIKPWIPQEKDGGVTIAENDAENAEGEAAPKKGAYVKIKCSITQNGVNLLDEECIYAPLEGVNHSDGGTTPWDGIWKAGVKYTYTMTFGLGHNKDGQLNGWPILFSVTTTDWEAANPADVQL